MRLRADNLIYRHVPKTFQFFWLGPSFRPKVFFSLVEIVASGNVSTLVQVPLYKVLHDSKQCSDDTGPLGTISAHEGLS